MRDKLRLTSMILAAALWTLGGGCSTDIGASDGVEVEGLSSERPVIVELFTSQGCSSCPPADRLLSTLGDGVIPLSFHVDYWNYIGWTDPFSNSRWSERQRRYGAKFKRGSIYTPQLVADGAFEGVGSDTDAVEGILARAASRPQLGTVELTLDAAASTVRISAELGDLQRRVDLVLAITESALETPVKSGENTRRNLRNDHVVRHFKSIATVAAGKSVERTHKLVFDPTWQREHLQVVAFLQDPKTLEIHGAARLRLANSPKS